MLDEEETNEQGISKVIRRLKSNFHSNLNNGKLPDDINIDEKKKFIEEAKMSTLLKLIEENKLEKLYENEYLYFLFHYVCVVSVIFRTKWKRFKLHRYYYDYVTPSDEAFAIIVLENNLERYKERGDSNIDEESYSQKTKYTITNEKRLKGIGWKRQGIIRFAKLQIEVEDMRERIPNRIKELAKHLKTCYRQLYNKNDESEEEILSQEEFIARQEREKREEEEIEAFMRKTAKKQRVGNTSSSVVSVENVTQRAAI